MRKSSIAFFVGIVVVLGWAGIWWHHYSGTPQYSLLQLAKAIKEKDYASAREYVDEDALSREASQAIVEATVDLYVGKHKPSKDDFANFGRAMTKMMEPKLRDLAQAEIRSELKQALSGQATIEGKDKVGKIDLSLFSSMKIDRVDIVKDEADVVLGGLPQPNDFQLQCVRLKMRHVPDSRVWKIVSLPDLKMILTKGLAPKSPLPATP